MRKYHLILADGNERDITAGLVTVSSAGALQLMNQSGELIAVFAAGAWLALEVERLDDK